MKYIVKQFNGDYSPSYRYEGKDKDIAIAVAQAYIQQGRSIMVIEQEENSETEGK